MPDFIAVFIWNLLSLRDDIDCVQVDLRVEESFYELINDWPFNHILYLFSCMLNLQQKSSRTKLTSQSIRHCAISVSFSWNEAEVRITFLKIERKGLMKTYRMKNAIVYGYKSIGSVNV